MRTGQAVRTFAAPFRAGEETQCRVLRLRVTEHVPVLTEVIFERKRAMWPSDISRYAGVSVLWDGAKTTIRALCRSAVSSARGEPGHRRIREPLIASNSRSGQRGDEHSRFADGSVELRCALLDLANAPARFPEGQPSLRSISILASTAVRVPMRWPAPGSRKARKSGSVTSWNWPCAPSSIGNSATPKYLFARR